MLSLTASGGVSYRWDDNTTNAVRTVSADGLYSVTVTNTATGCSSATSTTVSSNTAAPTVAINPTSGTITCAVTSLTLTASGTGLSYAWTGSTAGATKVVSASGIYSVTATAANGCTTTTSTTVFSNTATPTVSLAASNSLNCSLSSSTLTATATGFGALTYAFRNTSGALAGSPSANSMVVVSTAGSYSVVVTAGNGCTAVSNSVTVSQNTAFVGFGVTASTSVCAGNSVTLTASGCTGGTVNWPGGAGLPGITGNIFSTSISGTYTATCTVGACSTTANGTATIGAGLTATLTPSPSATLTCALNTITLTANVTGSGLTYVFAGPLGTLAGSGATCIVSTSGVYSVTVTGSNGCTTSANTTVYSNSATPTASIMASSSLSCANPTVTLTGSGGNSYLFSGAGASTLGLVSQSGNQAVVNQAGSYSLTVTNTATGCFSTTDITVTGSLAGATPMPTLPASVSTICEGGSVRLAAVVSGTATGYQWYRNGLIVSGQTSATLILTGVQAGQAGSYSLVVTSGCGSATSSAFMLTVNPLPTVTLLVPNNASVAGSVITLPAPLTGVSFQTTGGVSYERMIIIDRINGYEIRQVDSNTNGVFPINQTGPFRLTVTDGNGCKRTVEGIVQTR